MLAGAPDGRNDVDDLRARLPAIDRIATSPAWRAARGFARRWLEPAHVLHQSVRNVWLEFNLVAAARAGSDSQSVERPSIFWGPDPGAPTPTRALVESIAGAFPLFPADVPLDTLDRAVRSLPEGARVFQIGAMDLRGDVRLRLCAGPVAPDMTAGWLTSIGWPGDGAALDAFVRRVEPLADRFALDFDLTPTGVGPKVGLECYRTVGDVDAARWTVLFDMLRAEGLVVGQKRAAVDAFPARTRFASAEYMSQGDGSYIYPALVRAVHHIKVGFERDRATDAKGYLGVYRPGVNLRSARAAGAPPD